MLKIFNKISNRINIFFLSLNSFREFKGKKIKFVFFSEGKSYQKYSKFIIDVLCERYPHEVYYFSIDYEDKIIFKLKFFYQKFINLIYISIYFSFLSH